MLTSLVPAVRSLTFSSPQAELVRERDLKQKELDGQLKIVTHYAELLGDLQLNDLDE